MIKNSRLGDIVHVRAFNQHLIILSNHEDATKLMHEAKYSDRLQTVMLHELYVSVVIPTLSLILFYNRMAFSWGVTPMPYGPEWRFCRKLLHEQFNRHEVVHYATQQEESTRMMLRDLLNTPGDFCAHVNQWVSYRHLRCHNSHNSSCRWAARIVVDIGYGIDIGNDNSYVTLAKRVSECFELGIAPFAWLVDIFPIRTQSQL